MFGTWIAADGHFFFVGPLCSCKITSGRVLGDSFDFFVVHVSMPGCGLRNLCEGRWKLRRGRNRDKNTFAASEGVI